MVAITGGNEHHVASVQRHAPILTYQPAVTGKRLDDLQKIVSDRRHAETAEMVTFEDEYAAGGKFHLDRLKGAGIEHDTTK
jgi:hypothetical protein